MKLKQMTGASSLMIAFAIMAGCSDSTGPSELDAAATRRLSVGETTTCALNGSAKVYCWGENGEDWQYGVSPTTDSTTSMPFAVPVPPLYAITGGMAQHMCGITSTKSAVCWGRGGYGQLG